MDDRAIAEMFGAEERHFWFVGTRRIVLHALARRLPFISTSSTRALALLDLGCGTGFTVACGRRLGQWTGLDTSTEALRLARQRVPSATWIKGTATALPFPDASFDGLTCLDVIEHIKDDLSVVREIHRVLAPGGVGVLTVPGWPLLFGPHDLALGHVRRYKRAQLHELLSAARLHIELLSSYNLLLAPALIATRLLLNLVPRKAGTDVGLTPSWVNRPLAWLLGQERLLADRLPLRGGISLLAIVRATQ